MKLLSMLMLLWASIGAAQQDYLPLQVGNQWVLQTAGSKPELLTIEVQRSKVKDNRTYFLVTGYAPSPVWLRKANGTVFALNEETGREDILAQVSPGAGRYQTQLSGCEQAAQNSSQVIPHRGSNYDLQDTLTITYAPNGCRDIGFQTEVYAPGIGLVRRSLITLAGLKQFDLVFARVNGEAKLGNSKEIVLVYNFRYGSKGWLPGFTDYSLKTSDLRMLAELRELPDELAAGGTAYFLQGMNRSDDLFMFLKKQVTQAEGIEPNASYHVAFALQLASNAQKGCSGVGGAPGESVYLKAGVVADEPLAVLEQEGDVRLSADKGQQAEGGAAAGVVGNIANGVACGTTDATYVRLQKDYAHATPVQTDDRSSLWLLLGTDSAFEGLTGLYYEAVIVRINPAVGLPAPTAARK